MSMLLRRSRLRKNTPTVGDVHVSVPLTHISVAFVQRQTNFIADRVFPIVPVAQKSNVYYTFDRSDFLRDEARTRADGTESAGGGFSLATSPYACLVEAFHKDVGDQARKNADSVLQLDRAATEFVTQKLLIRRERRWVTSFFTTGIWTTDMTGVASAPSGGQFIQWDQAASDPANDIETGKSTILGATGMEPNTLVLGYATFAKLRNNAKVRDQFKYTSAESINEDMMARFFNVDRVLVSKGVYATNTEGAATTTATIAGKHALLCYTTPSPALFTPTAGYTFAWNEYAASSTGIAVSKLRAPLLRADRVEGELAHDMRVVSSLLGYFFSGAVA